MASNNLDDVLIDMVIAFMHQNRQSNPPNYIGFNMLINPVNNRPWTVDEMISALQDPINKLKTVEMDKTDTGLPPSDQFPYFNTQLALSEADIQKIIDMNLGESMDINSFNMPRKELILKQGEQYRKDTAKFQELVKKYIKSINPKHQLYVLNRIQANTPFMLINPAKLLPPRIVKQIKYGYADLLRFLCNSVFNEDIARFNEVGQPIEMYTIKNMSSKEIEVGTNKYKGNPFYNPIWYPIPDNRSNILIDDLMNRNKAFYESKKRQIQQLYYEVNNTRMDETTAIKKVNQILHLMVDIYDRENNPVYLSKDPVLVDKPELYEYANFKNERPMETYNREHMMDTIYMLLSNKRAAPQTYGNTPMHNTGINVVERGKSRRK